jgi:hypothetical protein
MLIPLAIGQNGEDAVFDWVVRVGDKGLNGEVIGLILPAAANSTPKSRGASQLKALGILSRTHVGNMLIIE